MRLYAFYTLLVLYTITPTCRADFAKVDNTGSALPVSALTGNDAEDWGCTYDTKTGLLWEIKTTNAGLRDKRWTYSWFNSNPQTNGGLAGKDNGGSCDTATRCDTEKFVELVNKEGLCGSTDWRLPSIAELRSLINPAYTAAINTTFFPDLTVPNTKVFGYWSATPTSIPVSDPTRAAYLLLEKATVADDQKNKPHRVRLVSNPKGFKAAAATDVLLENFNDKTLAGIEHGLSFTKTLTGRGARFTRANESRIQYPFSAGFPTSGTLEFQINLHSAYRYQNFQLNPSEACAVLFTTDVAGIGDEPWPGSAWLTVCKNGDITWQIKTDRSRDSAPQTLTAPATRFRFKEWHIVSVSYGKKGQAIAVDGERVAQAPTHTQPLGAGGTQQAAVDQPTLGEAVSSVWANNQYDAGFEGLVDKVRISRANNDWVLGKDRPKLITRLAEGSFRKPNKTSAQAVSVLVNDYLQRHVFGKNTDQNWFQFFAKKGFRYTLEIPNDSVGESLNPGLELFNIEDKTIVTLIDNFGSGEGETVQWTAPDTALYRLRITNQPPFFRSNAVDNGYDLQIYLSDEPQQGIIKGKVLNNCSNNGVGQAEISAWLSDLITDSTFTHNTGEFGLPLNPDDYQLQSLASNFLNVNETVSVTQADITPVLMLMPPLSTCTADTEQDIDPVIQEQEAVAVYDAAQGTLIVRDVVADGTILYAELHDIGGYRFQLDRSLEIPNAMHSTPGTYTASTLTAELPSVFVGDKTYKVTLKHNGDWVFGIEKIE